MYDLSSLQQTKTESNYYPMITSTIESSINVKPLDVVIPEFLSVGKNIWNPAKSWQ